MLLSGPISRLHPDRIRAFQIISKVGLAMLILLAASSQVFSQAATVTFGQNRVQYKDFDWQYYESDHFTTYFYPGGQDIAKYVIKSAEDNLKPIEDLLNIKLHKKVDIMVYNTINDLNQTNIGIHRPEGNKGTSVDIPSYKIFVYFNGDHAHLDKQIREGIARRFVVPQPGGDGITEIVSNAISFQPEWYKQGLISYIGEDWSADMENQLRDGIMSGRFKKLNKLTPEEAIFVGHSIWHYVDEVYGKGAVGNLQYLVRINRSVDNGFLFALGTNLNETLQNWYKYYVARFNNEVKYTNPRDDKDQVKIRRRQETEYYQPRLSPDGKYVAYASNNLGRYKIHLMDLEHHKRKVIYRGGWRTKTMWTDLATPLIAWSPKSEKVGFVFDKKMIVRLGEYSVQKQKGKRRKEYHRIEKFSKVTSITYVDSKQLAMAAVRNGQSDVVLYSIASQTVKQITDDYYDDFTPAVVMVDSIRGVVFASNRPDDTLHKQRYDSQVFDKQTDLFFYPLDGEEGDNVLYRITRTPNANESYPQPFSDDYFSYLSEANGIRNQWLSGLEDVFDHNQKTYRFFNRETNEDDSISIPENMDWRLVLDTSIITLKSVTQEAVDRIQGRTFQYSNFSGNILQQNLAPEKNLAMDMVFHKGRNEFYKYDINTTRPTRQNYIQTDYIKRRNNIMLTEDSIKKAEDEKKRAEYESHFQGGKKVYSGHDFQSEYDYGVKLFDWDSIAAITESPTGLPLNTPAQTGYIFRFSKVRPYFVRFMIDNFAAQLDNTPIVTTYQPFNPQNPGYMYQPLNALFKIGITDIFEDYRLYGGITLPLTGAAGFSFKDMGYFLTYENIKKRWDKKFTVYYQGFSNVAHDKVPFYNTPIPENIGSVLYTVKTTYLESQFKYPFDVFHRIGLGVGYRNDRYVFKSVDTFSLNIPTYATNWVFLKAEYVFDNTIDVMTNIKRGFRAKAFVEFHKEFPTQQSGGIRVPGWNNQYFTELGFDARYYLKIWRQMTFAARMSFATSLGNSKMIHYLGGLDNNLLSIRTSSQAIVQAPINDQNRYVYQTIAAPMRGFTSNSRNGNSYALINAELRIPLITMLMNRPSKSEIVRNFMIVGFADCGTAWEGLSPFSDNNPLFTVKYPNSASVVTVKQYKTPVILGTGFGLRTSLLGYFMKFDTAWGLDTGLWSDKPIYYFSFGYDF